MLTSQVGTIPGHSILLAVLTLLLVLIFYYSQARRSITLAQRIGRARGRRIPNRSLQKGGRSYPCVDRAALLQRTERRKQQWHKDDAETLEVGAPARAGCLRHACDREHKGAASYRARAHRVAELRCLPTTLSHTASWRLGRLGRRRVGLSYGGYLRRVGRVLYREVIRLAAWRERDRALVSSATEWVSS